MKEEAKNKKLQRMKDALAKQGIKVTEAIDIAEKAPEIVLKLFQGYKFCFGKFVFIIGFCI